MFLVSLPKLKKYPEDSIELDQTIQSLCPHSLDLVTLLFEFEDEFSISISDEAARELKTVQDIVVGVEKLLESHKTDSVTTA